LRLATVSAAGEPHVVPATFAVVGDVIVIAVDHKPKRHGDLKRLRNIRANPNVTALVDRYEDDWEQLWWARADGTATQTEADAEPQLFAGLVDKYPQYREVRPQGAIIRITVNRWSGWAYAQD
jgi:PPOX class probable F420-dependent enzyme